MDYVSLYFMEKRAPHYKLQEVLAIVSAHGLGVFTATAAFNAAAMRLKETQASTKQMIAALTGAVVVTFC